MIRLHIYRTQNIWWPLAVLCLSSVQQLTQTCHLSCWKVMCPCEKKTQELAPWGPGPLQCSGQRKGDRHLDEEDPAQPGAFPPTSHRTTFTQEPLKSPFHPWAPKDRALVTAPLSSQDCEPLNKPDFFLPTPVSQIIGLLATSSQTFNSDHDGAET